MATQKLTVEETYTDLKTANQDLMARLADLVEKHQDAEKPTWGEAGDLDQVNEYLGNAVRFLSGEE